MSNDPKKKDKKLKRKHAEGDDGDDKPTIERKTKNNSVTVDDVDEKATAKKSKKLKREIEAGDDEETSNERPLKLKKSKRELEVPPTTEAEDLTVLEEQQHASLSKSILTDEKFDTLPIGDKTKGALKQLGFTYMSQIQAQSIPECLVGQDLVGAAKTGSGKTLAFVIPIIELLVKVSFTRQQGTGAIVISPTRELSLQIYGVLRDIMERAGHMQTHGLIIGGANRKAEADRLSKGVNILVATPGRLLDHLMNTQGFHFQRLQMLVIDEADRILDIGFEEDLHQILKLIPKERQTLLFSATQTKKVEDLTKLSMKSNPVFVGVHDSEHAATVEGLQQGYVICPERRRFELLYTFLKKNRSKKIMVRMCESEILPPIHTRLVI